MPRPRILIADDHRLMAEAMARMLAPRYEVVEVVVDGRELLEAAPRLAPDVVVLDVGMPHVDGLEACRALCRRHPAIRVVVVTMHAEPELALAALRAGARAFLLKTDGSDAFAEGLEAALAGRTWVSASLRDEVARLAAEPQSRGGLTPRQRQILALLARGLSMKQAALELGITPRTVAFHKYRIMERHGLDSSAGLVRLALQEGLVPPTAGT